MAECTFCKAETQLYENGVPVCIACDENRKQAKPADVRTMLVNAVDEATARVNAMSRSFDAMMNQVPTGLPHADGTQRIQNASQQLDQARKAMMKAHNRLNDYLARGIVPEDLKRSG